MDRGHPPLDFPFYGLPPTWVGPRWVESITGPLGHPADGIWLRHGSALVHDARSPWLRVGTLRGDRFPGASRESRTAFSALLALVDATMPSPADRPPDYTERVGDVVAEHADRHASWRTVTWSVDGAPVTASMTTWAGGWAAFATLPSVDVAVVGHLVDPAGLHLAEVADSAAYHFDLHAGPVFPITVEESRRAAGVDPGAGDDVWWPAHEDHTHAMT
ncbi:hypothetical protein EUA06_02930 [Nocardioides glacieisoli]|uniref:Uncharacterized protein n=1 Tax=Nocardioides glacieisoli TaxID=1168730 RepID=A0A4Q2S4P7_9ACTN|nr:hypothetical protein [Nocardioides glacieisoli]RYB96538.1 hypothetical protein EUA06_02930 [Nocardioides glacieisoli]